ncbi:hypothetical protein LUZ61_013288 [Rhynchospora tenuis]|uniref:TNase-like domain-containing protein n=1 Tax=Rhynchospora tenuis TaxID=198213 RepID=A0AAD5W974_9POAL|nr:hypothetical protein LUZ61_013288 [Rhynchospora tenuis]
MGNVLVKCLKGARDDTPPASPPHQPAIASTPHFASPAPVGLAALLAFETTSQVPEGLSQHVILSKMAQAKWNDAVLVAPKESNPPPRMPEEAVSLATDALEDESDAEFLEVDAKLVGDGDGMIVHVDTDDPDEVDAVPIEVREVTIQRHQARAVRDFPQADALNEIIITAGYRKYRVIYAPNSKEILAWEYHIRLWYADILAALGEPNRPRMPKEAESFVTDALEDESDAESLEDESDAASLEDEIDTESLEDESDAESLEVFSVNHIEVSSTSSLPEGVQLELYTLPVDAKLVGDGDGMIVHVEADYLYEVEAVPMEIQKAVRRRRRARAVRDYRLADALNKDIMGAGYRIIDKPNAEEILAREYRIRLRGIDAPEMNMEYGREARDELRKLVHGMCLTIQVYEKDRYGRLVADVYCNDIFIQEELLRKGCAWHYKAYDKRSSFAQWQRGARNAGRGLWANPNPSTLGIQEGGKE